MLVSEHYVRTTLADDAMILAMCVRLTRSGSLSNAENATLDAITRHLVADCSDIGLEELFDLIMIADRHDETVILVNDGTARQQMDSDLLRRERRVLHASALRHHPVQLADRWKEDEPPWQMNDTNSTNSRSWRSLSWI